MARLGLAASLGLAWLRLAASLHFTLTSLTRRKSADFFSISFLQLMFEVVVELLNDLVIDAAEDGLFEGCDWFESSEEGVA